MFAWWIVLLISNFLLDIVSCATTTYSVKIGSQATIIGYHYDEPPGIVFLGIPYAQPMTAQNRFAKPQRRDPSGNINAFHYGAECMQTDVKPIYYDEDCLFLNIFTPQQANITQNRYPVYMWIHGGGFIYGSGYLGSTEGILKNLVGRGVIVVSMNFRLGPFGFFSTRDSIAPGNYGLHDQIEAINWVKRYISYFGGDPKRITIGGHSSGSMACSLLTLSPLSNHLFQQAALESGSGFSTGYLSNAEVPTYDASKSMAIDLGCATDAQWEEHNPAQMAIILQCLRSKSAQAILEAKYTGDFVPVIDGPGGVLPELIETLALRRPPIPVILGNAHDEWLYLVLLAGLLHNASYVNRFTRQEVVSGLEHSDLLMYYNNSKLVEQAIEQAYISSENLNDQDHVEWCAVNIKLYSDLLFIGPVLRDAMFFHQTNSPVYLYSFDYLAPGALKTVDPKLRGVGHFWEVQYLFGYPGTQMGGWQLTADDTLTENIMGQYWTDFIKTGIPAPNWPRFGVNMEFMSLGPRPTPSTGFHNPGAKFFACTVPAIEGYRQPWCT